MTIFPTTAPPVGRRRPDSRRMLFLPGDLVDADALDALDRDARDATAYASEHAAPTGWGDATATPGTGALEARATVNPWQPSAIARSCAALSIAFAPERRMSRIRFSASVRAVGATDISLPADAADVGLDYTADIILTGWEVDPARGSWRRIRRSVRRTVLDPQSPRTSPGRPTRFDGELAVDHLLRSGRRYTFQAAFQVGIVSDLRERDRRTSYRGRADEQITRRVALSGAVTRMSLETLRSRDR